MAVHSTTVLRILLVVAVVLFAIGMHFLQSGHLLHVRMYNNHSLIVLDIKVQFSFLLYEIKW